MAKVFNKDYTKNDLMRYIGDISQIADARYSEIKTGRGKGVSVIDVRTGGGLNFSILPDRGMDIAWAEHKGTPLAHISKCGVTSRRGAEKLVEEGRVKVNDERSILLLQLLVYGYYALQKPQEREQNLPHTAPGRRLHA